MASLTLNFSIGDIFTPIKNTLSSFYSKEKLDIYSQTFDLYLLKLMSIVILIGTIMVIIMSIPHFIKSVISTVISLQTLSKTISVNPKTMASLTQIITLLPLLMLVTD